MTFVPGEEFAPQTFLTNVRPDTANHDPLVAAFVHSQGWGFPEMGGPQGLDG